MPRAAHRTASALAVVALCAAGPLSACKIIDEKLCSPGEYAVKSTGDEPATNLCLKPGEPVPSGWATYPPGATPTEYPPEK